MVRVGVGLVLAFKISMICAKASCLEEYQEHMDGIFHHGPYQIDGHFRNDQGEGRSEVKFIYPHKVSIKSYDAQGTLTFGSIDIDNRAWRLDPNGHWITFTGIDSYSLKNEIARGSGNFKTAQHVTCPDPVPNNIDDNISYQYTEPFRIGSGSYLLFIEFNRDTNLPVKSAVSWSSVPHSGEQMFKYRFDPYIHVDPPISDPVP